MSFFFGCKIRDLSDKSWNGGDSKKHRKNSQSASSLPDDILVMVLVQQNALKC